MSKRIDDNRWVAELPSGIIKNPQLKTAGVDLWVNDVVHLVDSTVYPVYDRSVEIYGFVAARGIKGKQVLVAAK